MQKQTKIAKLEKHLKKYTKQGITGLDALRLFGLYRLGAEIFILRKRGMNITTIKEERNGVTYARYVYTKDKKSLAK